MEQKFYLDTENEKIYSKDNLSEYIKQEFDEYDFKTWLEENYSMTEIFNATIVQKTDMRLKFINAMVDGKMCDGYLYEFTICTNGDCLAVTLTEI